MRAWGARKEAKSSFERRYAEQSQPLALLRWAKIDSPPQNYCASMEYYRSFTEYSRQDAEEFVVGRTVSRPLKIITAAAVCSAVTSTLPGQRNQGSEASE